MRIHELTLDERKTADLYHTTGIDNLPKILHDKALMPSRNNYVSLTRDKRYNYAAIINEPHEVVTFVIDQAKLAYNKKIEPYDWHMDPDDDNDPDSWARDPEVARRSESEERVKGPLSLKYVKTIILPIKNNKLINAIKRLGVEVKIEPAPAKR